MNTAKIFYFTLQDEQTKEEKLDWFERTRFEDIPFERVTPDRKANWINLTDNDFDSFLPLIDKQVKAGKSQEAVFQLFSAGVKTQRDEWVYDFSKDALIERMKYFVEVYTERLEQEKIRELDIKWDRELNKYIERKISKKYKYSSVVLSSWRPFIKKYFYSDKHFNGMTYQIPNIFHQDRKNATIQILGLTKYKISVAGTKKTAFFTLLCKFILFVANNHKTALNASSAPEYLQEDNAVIFCTDVGTQSPFILTATDCIPNLHLVGTTAQCLPLYRYNENGNRIDNITDWGLTQFQTHYNDSTITKEAIFHYTYAVLHHPTYRSKYELNLKREFPRLPFYPDFHQWAAWGEELMDLHLNYETIEPYPLRRIDKGSATAKSEAPLQESLLPTAPDSSKPIKRTVPKAKLKAEKTEGKIFVDTATTLEGVPAIAWEYKLGNRCALEWILDQYKEKKPKDPTIAKLFNTYKFADYKESVIDLLQRVCTVSIKTMDILRQMPTE